ncbi:tRNA uridine-5-carboxymethylaminomethyl(34) synthesis GTPase MnmE [Helicobacter sp. 16-1353]|uniref:tRNA uridine-5-carboxymethylaminomethyl(34) synthesis GTPase MnmE n=1 Tax=Helicobacter sp. 16-1353 TaxID=2004996 RepID=UPI000DCC43C0|nr:tRNA uridine-5-carboxymethylaminomethyl(34) synthesis GTPase MnmE [Helicobacter sp. 16-1353]RAX53869.1 tRNA uridine-5-carboxymethylaminomethyl(34) synthesis GTPase MnmE [Helicobacter sp. 16-1353]
MNNDTIVAISTPIGISALSIVRLSGENALLIAKKLTKSQHLKPRYAHLKYIYNSNDNVIDRGIVIYFKAPNSFNGWDIVEFQTHGGISVPKSIVNECLNLGARLANPGEFSKIALMNGKLDLSTIESISKLILAQSTQAQEILGRILKGDLGRFIESLRGDLIEILAHIEVMIDYAEEDLPKDLELSIETKLQDSIKKLDEIHKHSLSMQNIIDGHRLVIIGRPNVGKSSLLNKLLLKDRAITSNLPGTTRDILEESITINNQIIKIIDTAGIREKNDNIDEIEKIGMQKSIEYLQDATIILAVFDGSRKFDDDEILEILANNKDKIIIAIINKSDKLQIFDEKKIAEFEMIKISTKDDSVFNLRELIGEKITLDSINNQNIILSSNRQIDCVKHCINTLNEAKNNIADFEIFSFNINEALHSLDLLSKPFDNDEMLDSMFSEFCLGK